MADDKDTKTVVPREETRPVPTTQAEEEQELRMSFTEHLAELRTRIIRSFVALGVAFILCYIFSNQIFHLLARPLSATGFAAKLPGETALEAESPQTPPEAGDPALEPGATAATPPEGLYNLVETQTEEKVQWVILNPIESVIVQIKLAMYAGILLALPFILWQLCAFVFPGLHKGERRVVQILIFGCSILGIAGMIVAYFGVFPLVLPYLLRWVPEGVAVQLRMNETMTIILYGLLGFAIAFQFPMAVLILVYMDLLTPASLKQYRKLAIVVIAFLSAVLTPPDPISMSIMMLPLILLYEISIWASYLVIRRKRAAAAAA